MLKILQLENVVFPSLAARWEDLNLELESQLAGKY